ncbi:hypothetical protein EDD16DRAFT_1632166 [Pisolithus croceorrhizus]|nr:hypothetical protein EDD16DRAFT_1632166 [Pisolithus croceorrhizus]
MDELDERGTSLGSPSVEVPLLPVLSPELLVVPFALLLPLAPVLSPILSSFVLLAGRRWFPIDCGMTGRCIDIVTKVFGRVRRRRLRTYSSKRRVILNVNAIVCCMEVSYCQWLALER